MTLTAFWERNVQVCLRGMWPMSTPARRSSGSASLSASSAVIKHGGLTPDLKVGPTGLTAPAEER